MVFKLGADGSLPEIADAKPQEQVIPTMLEVSEEVMAKGASTYGNVCSVCHGDHAQSSGLVPNLRYSAITTSAEAWKSVVLDGALSANGMPNFGKVFDEATAEAVRAYVIAEANSERDAEFYKTVKAEAPPTE
jgi:quinohemoprotein ethanol dehydrogenase